MFGLILRPPGAQGESEFLKLCVHCGQCARICPHHCVRLRGGWGRARHTPEIRPRERPCLLCMRCPPICPSGALNPATRDMRAAGMGRAYILREKCHNFNGGVMCWTCYDRCPLRGAAMVLEGGLIPAVTPACAGCGVCEYVCPVQAVITLPPHASPPPGAVPMLPEPPASPGGSALGGGT